MLIKNARFIIRPEKVLENQDILVEGNTIVEVGKNLKSEGDVIDARGKLVMPGLVNTHGHFPMVLFRGAGDDMPLMQWLEKRIWPMEAKLTDDDITKGARVALLEMLASGTTTFADMYWYSDESVEAIKKAGIKAMLSWAVVDKDKTSQKGDPLRLAEAFIKRWYGDAHIMPSVGPHAIYTCSKETLLLSKELAMEHGVVMHTHVSETELEVKNCVKQNRIGPVEYLEKIGFFGHDTLAAHCVWVNEKEASILAKNKVSVSHCPASNMKLASGIMPLAFMQKASVNLTIGTDGAASNNTLDMFDSVRLAALLHKVSGMNPTAAKAHDILKAATVNGAKALNLNTGEIAAGKDADMIIMDIDKAHWSPVWDPISNLVYSAKSSDISTVIANGKVVMDNDKFHGLDKGKILKEAESLKKKFSQHLK